MHITYKPIDEGCCVVTAVYATGVTLLKTLIEAVSGKVVSGKCVRMTIQNLDTTNKLEWDYAAGTATPSSGSMGVIEPLKSINLCWPVSHLSRVFVRALVADIKVKVWQESL